MIKNMNYLVSVIVPIYKVEKDLSDCVLSICNQTYRNLEIILVDDGSPDKCGQMCDEFARNDVRIKVIHKINGGLSQARNAGMGIMTGDYVTFVDSDDILEHGLKVIYDAAHAFAVKYKGESSACFGDASMFSFHATKVFNTIEGGCVCFKDDSWIQLLNDMKNFGIHGPESVQFVGANAKMNEFQAAMGICNLKHLDEEIEKRKHVVEHYRSRLEGVEGIKLSIIQKDVESNYAYFPVVFDGYKYTRNDGDQVQSNI